MSRNAPGLRYITTPKNTVAETRFSLTGPGHVGLLSGQVETQATAWRRYGDDIHRIGRSRRHACRVMDTRGHGSSGKTGRFTLAHCRAGARRPSTVLQLRRAGGCGLFAERRLGHSALPGRGMGCGLAG